MDAVAPCLGANVVHGVTRTGSDAFDDVGLARNAKAKDIDEWIASICRLECDLPANGWNADAVAVAGDPSDDAFEQTARIGRVEVAEPQ